MRLVVLVDGEHYPPVVRAAVDGLGGDVVGAVLLGGGEKLAGIDLLESALGLPVVRGVGAEAALVAGLDRFAPDVVVDLSDEPVVDSRLRMRLAARALSRGVTYRGSDFKFDPPPRPRLATKPSVAVIGTGKRTGKTAVSVALSRLLVARGTPPVVVAMGRGGPPEPEVVDPAQFDLSPAALVALAASGRHAASDHLEDALMAGVVTIGTRRCGGGLAGAPADATFAAGVAMGNTRPEPLFVFEGSGAAIPPVHADATICMVPDTADPELVTGYLGAYRLLLTDLIVVTMMEPRSSDFPRSSDSRSCLEESIRGVAPGANVTHVAFRPSPLEPISGRRVFYATTAPPSTRDVLVGHLEREHRCRVVGISHNLAHRPQLVADLEGVGNAEVMLVELKAAAVDVVASFALDRGLKVTFCDNEVVPASVGTPFNELAQHVVGLAEERFRS
ncbi:MAG: 2,3-diphosphoglycerate synthetase [Acidimicrobiales bacterium]